MGMGDTATLQKSEWTGIAVAVAAHVGLAWALYLAAQSDPAKVSVPDRMVVSLAEEVALESTAPDPSAEPQAAIAPVIAPEPAPMTEQPPEPAVRPVERPVERPVIQPRPSQRSSPQPRQTQRPARSTPSPAPSPRQTQAARSGGGSRLGDNFLDGARSGAERSDDSGTPAATFGQAEAASLNSLIGRQVKPHWSSPQGPDAEKLVTIVRFDLGRNGALIGTPTCTRQSGVTPTNEAQKDRHCENAIRAVRLAAPFRIPSDLDQFYAKWKRIETTFDRRL